MLHFEITTGTLTTNPLETVAILNSLRDVLMWSFFIVIAIIVIFIIRYIKKKNASGGKHS